jgi:hypothetical protein
VRAETEFEILKAIVGLDPIDVVHRFVLPERPPERFRHHYAVFRNTSTPIPHRRSKMIVPE